MEETRKLTIISALTSELCILDESTKIGGVGTTISAVISEEIFDMLDAPVKKLSMGDAPDFYEKSMEKSVDKK